METQWPNTSLPETELVLQLDSLRNTLTQETATKLCSQRGCGYLLDFVTSYTLNYKDGMAAYIRLLISIAKIVNRSTFMNLFPKNHGGCASIQLFCMVNLHRQLADDVFDLFRVLLNDNEGEIVTKEEVLAMGNMMRKEFTRRGDPFPYMGNCLDFSEYIRKIAEKLGTLIENEEFGLDMETDRTKSIEWVKQYFAGKNTVNRKEFLRTFQPATTSN